jgi:hypothetical protein
VIGAVHSTQPWRPTATKAVKRAWSANFHQNPYGFYALGFPDRDLALLE